MQTSWFKKMWDRHAVWIICIAALPIFYFISTIITNPSLYPNKDFFTFWLSGRLTVLEKNPYIQTLWLWGREMYSAARIPDATFVYPMPLALLFAPLGFLPLKEAFLIWDTLTQEMILLSFILLLRFHPKNLSLQYFPPLLAGLILFRPTYVTLIQAQLSGLFLLVITGVLCLWEKGKWWQGSILLSLLAFKPSLGVPFIAVLILYLLLKKRIRSILVLGASGIVFLLLGFIQDPNWIVHYWQIGNEKLAQTFGSSPTIWGITAHYCHFQAGCSYTGGGILCGLILLAAVFWLVKERKSLSPSLAVSLAILVTLLVTPYVWPYDQLLLVIPLLSLIMERAKAGGRFLPTAILFIAVDILAYVLLYISVQNQNEVWNFLLPLMVFGFVMLYLARGKARSQA